MFINGCRPVPDLLGKFLLTHIDAHTDDDVLDVPLLHAHLRENAANLFTVHYNIVGPLDADLGRYLFAVAAQCLPDALRHRQCHD